MATCNICFREGLKSHCRMMCECVGDDKSMCIDCVKKVIGQNVDGVKCPFCRQVITGYQTMTVQTVTIGKKDDDGFKVDYICGIRVTPPGLVEYKVVWKSIGAPKVGAPDVSWIRTDEFGPGSNIPDFHKRYMVPWPFSDDFRMDCHYEFDPPVVKRIEGGKAIWGCSACNYEHAKRDTVRTHVTQVEQRSPFIRCVGCGKMCSSLSNLNEHRKKSCSLRVV